MSENSVSLAILVGNGPSTIENRSVGPCPTGERSIASPFPRGTTGGTVDLPFTIATVPLPPTPRRGGEGERSAGTVGPWRLGPGTLVGRGGPPAGGKRLVLRPPSCGRLRILPVGDPQAPGPLGGPRVLGERDRPSPTVGREARPARVAGTSPPWAARQAGRGRAGGGPLGRTEARASATETSVDRRVGKSGELASGGSSPSLVRALGPCPRAGVAHTLPLCPPQVGGPSRAVDSPQGNRA